MNSYKPYFMLPSLNLDVGVGQDGAQMSFKKKSIPESQISHVKSQNRDHKAGWKLSIR